MVVFTCTACGDSLKKAQVEKHVNMCRGCQVLSCIDCGKDFWGEDYRNHVKCISEDQKYGGKGYAAKAKKGDVKQQQWIERIHGAMNKPGISAKMKDILNQVSSYDNVPRKKQKFQNWMKNSLKIMDRNLHDQVWDIFSAAISNQAPVEAPKPCETTQPPAVAEAQTNGSQQQNGTSEEEPAAAKKKLNKRERKEARQMKSGKKKKSRPENGTAQEEEEEEGEQACAKKSKRKRSCEEDGETNGRHAEEETSAKKRKKGKEVEQVDQMAEEEAEVAEEQTARKGKFNWKGTIKAVLRQAPDEGLSVKKVRKKVLAAYYSFSGEGNFKSEEDLLALFNKKLNGNPKFKVLKDKVRLVK